MQKKLILIGVLTVFIIFVSVCFLRIQPQLTKSIVYHHSANTVDLSKISTPPQKDNSKKTTIILSIDSENFSELDKYQNINSLFISDVDFANIPSLKDKNIFTLRVSKSKNFDLNVINPERLKHLYITDTDTKNFEKIGGFTLLEELTIEKCKIKDFIPIKMLSNLKNISIGGINIDDMNFFENNPKLEHIDISDSSISSLSGIEKFKDLEYLYITKSNLYGIIDISKSDKLRMVNFSDNDIENIVLPENSATIYDINLSYNNIKKIDNALLEKLKSKEYVNLALYGNFNLDCSNLKGYDFVSFGDKVSHYYSLDEYISYMNEIKSIAKETAMKCKTDIEKALYVFWYISHLAEYDYEYIETRKPNSTDIAHTGYGTIIRKLAVCDGFAYAYSDILNLLDVENYLYHGDLNSTNDDSSHAWNMVKIDGKYYHCDLTGSIAYLAKYEEITGDIYITQAFGKSDSDFINDKYFLLDNFAPKATTTLNETELNKILKNLIAVGGVQDE